MQFELKNVKPQGKQEETRIAFDAVKKLLKLNFVLERSAFQLLFPAANEYIAVFCFINRWNDLYNSVRDTANEH